MDEQPKQQPISVTPEKHQIRPWMGITALVLILVLVGLYIWKKDVFFKRPAPVNNQVPTLNDQEQPEQVKSGQIYYVVSSGGTIDQNKVKVFSASLAQDKPDEQIAEISGFPFFHGTYLAENTKLYSNGLDFFELNISEKKSTKLFSLPAKTDTRDAALSHDKKFLAYGVNTEDFDNANPYTSQLWLFNTETKKQTKLVDTQKVGLYQGYSVLGWSSDNKYIIVSNLGGDAGAVWGDVLRINASTGKIEKVQPLGENNMSFITGMLSPSGDKWLYSLCKAPATPDDIGELPCPDGTELLVYDFNTKQSKTVYRNTMYGDNVDKAKLRTIQSYFWQDNDNVLVVIPAFVYRLSLLGGEPVKIYERNTYEPQYFFNHYMYISYADKDYVVVTLDGENRAINLKTNKAVSIGPSDSSRQPTVIR